MAKWIRFEQDGKNGHEHRLGSGPLGGGDDRVTPGGVEIGDDDPGPTGSQQTHRGLAETRRAAGHQHHLVLDAGSAAHGHSSAGPSGSGP